MPDWSSISRQLRRAGLSVSETTPARPVGGGDISAAWRLQTKDGDIFLKTGPSSSFDMFEAEAEGLAELESANAVRVPKVLDTGQFEGDAYIALEWLPFERPLKRTERLLGEQLASMHRTTRQQFGWHRDNTIGLTPQYNSWSKDWPGFFGERRLGFQLRLAADNGFSGELQREGARVLERLPLLFDDYAPVASLLHGDLWGGNWASAGGVPVIFDPAVYFGDRETDLAMTQLFGGFGAGFYEAYETAWPLAPGHRERTALYQLYHVLNHLNLFGAGYLGRAMDLMRKL